MKNKTNASELLKEILKKQNISLEEVANKTNLPLKILKKILNKKVHITYLMATEFEKTFQIPLHQWFK
jgi:plasmid maintenance system antidote protein VapI